MSIAKSSNPFNGWNYFDHLGESSFMPNYYQQEMDEPMTFRSLSPKMYNSQKTDYFETDHELGDDSDALYEATLTNANFLLEKVAPSVSSTTSVDRLRQLLSHLNPNYSPLTQALSESPSVRSQFSSSSQASQPVVPSMVGFSMSDPRDLKGKGKAIFKPTM